MIDFIIEYLIGIGIPVLLMLTGLFYCFRLHFFHFLHPLKVIKSLITPEKEQRVSSAKALTLALAGTLGVGNMVGVASAISLGGYGAVFWMWVSAFMAMIVKYAEIVLAMAHRRFDKGGAPHGSAMYYIRDIFKDGTVGRVLALVFALFCILNAFTMGGMIQVNAAANAMEGVFGISPLAVGGVFAAVVLLSMRKGTGGILSITEKLVPIMSVGFIALSVAVIWIERDGLADALRLIFSDAFSYRSGICGIGGFLMWDALRYGTMRGILSNEAGCGTAPMAHAVSDCKSPSKQGMWGIFEVFVDTVLLCTLTALVIIMSDISLKGNDYMMMTVKAYSSVLGELAGGFIAVSVVLFALAAVLCWGHYGMECVRYICSRPSVLAVFIICYSACSLVGSLLSVDMILDATDIAIGGMTLINLSMLLVSSPEVKRLTEEYLS